jgi:hypothetical protein
MLRFAHKIWFMLLPLSLLAAPAQIILMRHAEISSDNDALSLKGRQRAMALEPFFRGHPSVLFHGLPSAIFASHISKETVEPLAASLNMSVQDTFQDPQALADELLTNPDYEGKMVLVCLPNNHLPGLVKMLGIQKGPKKWGANSYDRLWTLTYNDKDQVSFNDLPQKLLYGDSEK